METIIWDPVERLLGGTAITLGVICGFLYLYRYQQAKTKDSKSLDERILLFGLGMLMLGGTFLISSYYLLQFLVPGEMVGITYYGSYEEVSLTWKAIESISWVIFFMIYSIIILIYEKLIKRTRYILSGILVAFIVVQIAFLSTSSYEMMREIQYLCYIYLGFIVPLLFMVTARWSEIEDKIILVYLLTTLALVAVNISFLSPGTKIMNFVPIILPQLLISIGWIIGMIPIITDPEKLSERSKVWGVYIVFIITFYGYDILLIFGGGFNLIRFAGSSAFFGVSFYAGYDTMTSIRAQRASRESLASKDRPNIFGTFSRPRKVTEEEVSISKEKHTCLVCKNKLQGEMFICGDCGAYYCGKCSEVLKSQENTCWVCESALDASKPRKLDDDKKQTIEVAENIPKRASRAKKKV